MRHLFQVLKEHLLAKEDIVMATIVASSGSVPRGAGSRMLVGRDGLLAGTIGGGSVEYRAIQIAGQLLERKESCEHSFVLNREDVSNLGMICGGDVNVFFHYLSCENHALLELLERAENYFERRIDFWMISDLCDGGHFSLYTKADGLFPDANLEEDLISSLSMKPQRFRTESDDYFAEQIGFSGTVYVFGGGHVSQKLVPALAAVDFRCVVLDDREEFVRKSLFPDAVDTILCDFDHLDRSITITDQDFCCVMTRGHSYDTTVQAQLLATPACYIGVIGSRRKKQAVFTRLVEEFGVPEAELSRIVSPIGLEIKAETPAEIAVSITGQMIQVRAEKRGSLR